MDIRANTFYLRHSANPSRAHVLPPFAQPLAPSEVEDPISDCTLEVATLYSPLVIRGRVQDARPYGQPRSGVDQFRITAEVEEVFSGNGAAAHEKIVCAVYRMTEDAPIRQRDVGADLLLFLRPARLGQQETRDCDGCGWELDDEHGISPFVHLSRPVPERVLNQELELLSDPAQVLAAVRSVSGWKIDDHEHEVIQIRRASGQLVAMLEDGRLAERALRWSVSADPDLRSASVDLLRTLPDAINQSPLLQLLKDPYLESLEECCNESGPWGRRGYVIRQRAWEALQGRSGLKLESEPALSADPGLYRSASSLWGLLAGIVLFVAVTMGFICFLTADLVRKAWWTGIALTALVSGSAVFVHFWLIDVTEIGNNRVRSITLERGELMYWEIAPSPFSPLPAGIFWGVFRQGGKVSNWHDLTCNHEELDRMFLGWGPLRRLAVWPIIFLPLAPLPFGLFTLGRRRRRLRAGCCPFCGYDLRSSSDCCPECGRGIDANAPKSAATG